MLRRTSTADVADSAVSRHDGVERCEQLVVLVRITDGNPQLVVQPRCIEMPHENAARLQIAVERYRSVLALERNGREQEVRLRSGNLEAARSQCIAQATPLAAH